jgi:hypothetical protein
MSKHKIKLLDIIESVEFQPHEAFANNKPYKTQPGDVGADINQLLLKIPGSIGEMTWSKVAFSKFEVLLTICFNKKLEKPPIKLSWQLDFNKKISFKKSLFTFDSTLLSRKITL